MSLWRRYVRREESRTPDREAAEEAAHLADEMWPAVREIVDNHRRILARNHFASAIGAAFAAREEDV